MKSVSKSEEIYFLSGKRTAFGTYGGALKDLSATDLAVESARAALAQAKVSPEDIQHVVYGNVVQTERRRHLPAAPRGPARRACRCRCPRWASTACAARASRPSSPPRS